MTKLVIESLLFPLRHPATVVGVFWPWLPLSVGLFTLRAEGSRWQLDGVAFAAVLSALIYRLLIAARSAVADHTERFTALRWFGVRDRTMVLAFALLAMIYLLVKQAIFQVGFLRKVGFFVARSALIVVVKIWLWIVGLTLLSLFFASAVDDRPSAPR